MLRLLLTVWQQKLLLVGLWLLGQQLKVGQSFSLAVVVVVVAAGVALIVLHKLVPQQVGPLMNVPILSMKGRLPMPGAAAHKFEDAQPKGGGVPSE